MSQRYDNDDYVDALHHLIDQHDKHLAATNDNDEHDASCYYDNYPYDDNVGARIVHVNHGPDDDCPLNHRPTGADAV